MSFIILNRVVLKKMVIIIWTAPSSLIKNMNFKVKLSCLLLNIFMLFNSTKFHFAAKLNTYWSAHFSIYFIFKNALSLRTYCLFFICQRVFFSFSSHHEPKAHFVFFSHPREYSNFRVATSRRLTAAQNCDNLHYPYL